MQSCVFCSSSLHIECISFVSKQGGMVAQSVERVTPGFNPRYAARSLLVGSVSV